MQRGIILFAMLFMVATSHSQLLHESFENNANGWTNHQITGVIPFSLTNTEQYLGNASVFIEIPQAIGAFGAIENESWYVSPVFDLSNLANPNLVYYEQTKEVLLVQNHDVLYSTDYIGSGDPNLATWTLINGVIGQENVWKQSSVFSLPNNSNVYIAFYYKGASISFFDTPFPASKWYLDDLFIFDSPCTDLTIWKNNVWDNLTPTINSVAVFGDNYNTTTNGNVDQCKSYVLNGKNITITNAHYFNIENDVINNGTVTIENEATLVQNDNNSLIIGTGNFSTLKVTTNLVDKDRFTYFSSPISSANIGTVFTYANLNKIYSFDETIQDWFNEPSTSNMSIGKGYIVQGHPSNTYPLIANVNFSGIINNGIITQNIAFNSGGIDDDNTLIGNPYPSAISANDLLNANPNLDTFYFWTHNSAFGVGGFQDDYATYNLSGGTVAVSGGTAPTGNIASCQGFFTTATATGMVTFNNSMRLITNNNDFKNVSTNESEKIWVNLENDEGVFNQILVNFTAKGSENFDAQYDGIKYQSENALSFYSIGNQHEKFAIQARTNLPNNAQVRIPLGVEINDENINHLQFSIANSENLENVFVYLEDHYLNILHDLKASNYRMDNIEIGSSANRFELVFTKQRVLSTVKQTIDKLTIAIFNKNRVQFKTNSFLNIKQIQIYDVLGKEVIHKKTDTNEFLMDFSAISGTVFVAKIRLENNQLILRKFIRY